MTTTTSTAASSTFDRMTHDDRWLGLGYLGERHHALDNSDPEAPAQPALVEFADTFVLDVTIDWTADELFHWANSKDGRWFGDLVFGGSCSQADLDMAGRYVRKQSV